MTNDVFDKLAVSRPVNKSAAMAVSGGTHYEPNKKLGDVTMWHAPPKTVCIGHGQEDLTGVSFGRFKVIGRLPPRGGQKPAQWLVRCSCGVYEHRLAKSIRNPSNAEDRCQHCRHLAYLQKADRYRRTGKDG